MGETATNPDTYVHARNDDEYQRLRAQGEIWQGATEMMLDGIGLRPGMSCLDVGSGPGSVMRLMADRVGPDGHVTGLEIDGKLGGQALTDLKAQGGANFHLIEADMVDVDTVPGAPFDLVYCRLFLMHMQDPVAALEKMLGWTKLGGVVATQEFDFASIAIEPLFPGWAEFNRLFEGIFRGHGRNLRAGRQLPAQFEAAGLGAPDDTLADVKYRPLSEWVEMLIGVYQGLFAAAVELGIADPTRAEAFKADMADAAADGRHYCLTPILIGAWKRVPRFEAQPRRALLLAGHRVATYITAGVLPVRSSRRNETLGTDNAARCEACEMILSAGSGPRRFARKRGSQWRK